MPVIGPDDRRAPLARAAAVRKERAEAREALKRGRTSLREVPDTDTPAVRSMPVRALLESLPDIGKVRADRLLAELGTSASRRVRGLGARQRDRLLERCAPQQ
ncbi:integration host factor, actinobacterial type [Embleya sp. NPDC127516]|uniref:integration host factor, actinobacterial type n=1 Tax=Embleya sp. NPDC127516 TaxID=3363990 RepID=UPI0037F6F6F3